MLPRRQWNFATRIVAFLLAIAMIVQIMVFLGASTVRPDHISASEREVELLRQRVEALSRDVARLKRNASGVSLQERARRRALVTGAAGFIGSHLVDKLMTMDYEVFAMDNFQSGTKHHLMQWMDHENFHLILHDVVDPMRLEVDEIYHLAAPSNPVLYETNPIGTLKTSTRGTMNVLGLAKRNRARVLLASAGDIYGDSTENPKTEDDWGFVNTLGLRSCYEEGKRVAETMMYAYNTQNGVEVRVARIFNTYGPRMRLDDGRLMSSIISQALSQEPITVHGDGSQERSFMFVSDLVNGLVKLMESNYTQPVNFGHETPVSIGALVDKVREITGSSSSVRHSNPLFADLISRTPSTELAKRELDWRAATSLNEGLRTTIEYYRLQ